MNLDIKNMGFFSRKKKSAPLTVDELRELEAQFLQQFAGAPNNDLMIKFMLKATDFMIDSDRLPAFVQKK